MSKMNKTFKLVTAAFAAMVVSTSAAFAAGDLVKAPKQDWSFNGPFGVFDRASQQRGFQVFQEVCASCHSLEYIAFRNLTDIGFSADEAKAVAAEYQVPSEPNDEGEIVDRAAKPSDFWPSPYANAKEAAATNNGKAPPDLSLMAKARVGGADYIYGLLTGYEDHEGTPENLHYNKYFPGHYIAMAAPLSDGAVDYVDGTPNTVEQMAKDVSHFLMWAAEPKLEDRKSLGVRVMLFLLVLTFITFLAYRRVSKKVKGH
jgi:ubiquinol-cytochrome c reductase cytochrome c1 subunit